MKKGLVSVVIPLYNSVKYIGETIESVLEQTYVDWELIIVDDCSSDGSQEVVKSYCQRNNKIILIESIENAGGPARPRNMGMKKASGEYIAFLDSDDLWHPEKLKIQVEIMEKNEELLILGTNAETFPQRYKNKLFLRSDLNLSFESLLKSNKLITSSVLIRNSVISVIGYFDEDKRVIAAEDYDYWLRVLNIKNGKGFVLNRALVKYRLHSDNISLSNEKSEKGHYDKLLYIYKKYPKQLSSDKIIVLERDKVYLNLLRAVKEVFHRGQINWFQVLCKKEILITDRILLIVKKIILDILKQKA